MIALWIISLAILASYTFIIFKTDFELNESLGFVKWLVIASLILIIITVTWMGAQIWFRN